MSTLDIANRALGVLDRNAVRRVNNEQYRAARDERLRSEAATLGTYLEAVYTKHPDPDAWNDAQRADFEQRVAPTFVGMEGIKRNPRLERTGQGWTVYSGDRPAYTFKDHKEFMGFVNTRVSTAAGATLPGFYADALGAMADPNEQYRQQGQRPAEAPRLGPASDFHPGLGASFTPPKPPPSATAAPAALPSTPSLSAFEAEDAQGDAEPTVNLQSLQDNYTALTASVPRMEQQLQGVMAELEKAQDPQKKADLTRRARQLEQNLSRNKRRIAMTEVEMVNAQKRKEEATGARILTPADTRAAYRKSIDGLYKMREDARLQLSALQGAAQDPWMAPEGAQNTPAERYEAKKQVWAKEQELQQINEAINELQRQATSQGVKLELGDDDFTRRVAPDTVEQAQIAVETSEKKLELARSKYEGALRTGSNDTDTLKAEYDKARTHHADAQVDAVALQRIDEIQREEARTGLAEIQADRLSGAPGTATTGQTIRRRQEELQAEREQLIANLRTPTSAVIASDIKSGNVGATRGASTAQPSSDPVKAVVAASTTASAPAQAAAGLKPGTTGIVPAAVPGIMQDISLGDALNTLAYKPANMLRGRNERIAWGASWLRAGLLGNDMSVALPAVNRFIHTGRMDDGLKDHISYVQAAANFLNAQAVIHNALKPDGTAQTEQITKLVQLRKAELDLAKTLQSLDPNSPEAIEARLKIEKLQLEKQQLIGGLKDDLTASFNQTIDRGVLELLRSKDLDPESEDEDTRTRSAQMSIQLKNFMNGTRYLPQANAVLFALGHSQTAPSLDPQKMTSLLHTAVTDSMNAGSSAFLSFGYHYLDEASQRDDSWFVPDSQSFANFIASADKGRFWDDLFVPDGMAGFMEDMGLKFDTESRDLLKASLALSVLIERFGGRELEPTLASNVQDAVDVVAQNFLDANGNMRRLQQILQGGQLPMPTVR